MTEVLNALETAVNEAAVSGSQQERDYEATMKGDYLKAVDATLDAIRRWVREGEPASQGS